MEDSKEIIVAEAEVVDEADSVKLKNPVGGKQEINFDFSKITGGVLLKCERLAKKDDPGMLVASLSMTFQAHVAAAASGLRYDDIIGLSAPDFMAVTLRAQRFLSSGAGE